MDAHRVADFLAPVRDRQAADGIPSDESAKEIRRLIDWLLDHVMLRPRRPQEVADAAMKILFPE